MSSVRRVRVSSELTGRAAWAVIAIAQGLTACASGSESPTASGTEDAGQWIFDGSAAPSNPGRDAGGSAPSSDGGPSAPARDAGPSGPNHDAGSGPNYDAGSSPNYDAGSGPGYDAGSSPPSKDAGTTQDASKPVDAGSPPPPFDSGPVVPIGDGGPHTTYVVGDLPDYQWSSLPPSAVPWSKISELDIGFMWPLATTGGYTLGQDNWGQKTAAALTPAWESQVAAYATAGHAAGVRVVMLLGGAGGNPNPTGASGQDLFALATATDQAANEFATNIKSVLQSLQIDGVTVDWEDGSSSTTVQHAGMVRLAHQLRLVWPTALIFLPASPMAGDVAELAPAVNDVDAFQPMTYLDAQQWGGWTLPSPLTPIHDPFSNQNSIEVVLKKWAAGGVPASKVFMGAGGYGAVWGDTNGDHQAPNVPYANQSTVKTNSNALPNGESGSVCSDNAVVQTWVSKTVAAYPALAPHWDSASQTSYWGASSPTSLVTVPSPCGSGTLDVGLILYESAQSMQAKGAYVKAQGMKGIFFWTLQELADNSVAGTTTWPVLDAIP